MLFAFMDIACANVVKETDGGESFTAEDFLDMLNAEELGTNGGQASVEQDPRSDEQSEETPTMRSTNNSTRAPILVTQRSDGKLVTQSQLLRFLNRSGWRRIFQAADGDDDRRAERLAVEADDDDDEYVPSRNRRRRPRRGQDAFPKVPSDIGRELMDSGNFGTNERPLNSIERRKKLAARILRRELGLESPGKDKCANKLAAQELIPSSEADTIIHYDHRCYSGQFSDDGNFFFSCAQDFRVRMYDTSNPYNWKYYKTVTYPFGQWTITDASLSPDNRYLAYSSIRSMVCLAATDPNDHSEPHLLDFADNSPGRSGFFSHSHFGIWSIRFSGDGRELVAGTSDNSVNAYDVETQKPLLSIQGHEDDVNAVCFGDKSSPHLLYSGSDDATLKVWDRRSLQDQRAAGVFLGHTEGLTYIDSKGDGRYVLSNGKDQTMKLWDLRKMISTDKADQIDPTMWSLPFDYRFQSYDTNTYTQHPHDCSLVTFRGHSVLKTLIRCHFSPPGSTDSRYVYSGSEDGSIYIYNLDATVAGKVDVKRATRNTRPPSDDDDDEFMDYHGRDNGAWKTCVRDASWHPNAPIIAGKSCLRPLRKVRKKIILLHVPLSFVYKSTQHLPLARKDLRESGFRRKRV